MPRQIIDIGWAALNGADGDSNRDASQKCNDNFAELYAANWLALRDWKDGHPNYPDMSKRPIRPS